jgi:competence protein ComEA
MLRSVLSVIALATVVAAHTTLASAEQPPSGSRTAAKAALAGPVNINTASATELDALPGIGAKTAARIVQYRQKNGPFKKVEDLMNVRGVGEKNFLRLKNQITIGATKADHDRPQH